jgi:hypothetical protein
MQNRGLMPMVIEDTIRNGSMYKGKILGTLMYFSSINKISVITDVDSGRVITTSIGNIKQ